MNHDDNHNDPVGSPRQHGAHDDGLGDGGPVLSSDDPRVTAYALGEADAQECAEVERWLAAHPGRRAEIDAVADLAAVLGEELSGAPAPSLGRERREALERVLSATATGSGGGGRAGDSPEGGAGSTVRRLPLRPFLAAAAGLLAAVFLFDVIMLQGGEVGSRGGMPAPTARVRDEASPFVYELFEGKQGERLGRRTVDRLESGEERSFEAGAQGVVARSADDTGTVQDGDLDLDEVVRQQLQELGYTGGGEAVDSPVPDVSVVTGAPLPGGQGGPPPAGKLVAGENVSGSPGLLTGRAGARLLRPEASGAAGDDRLGVIGVIGAGPGAVDASFEGNLPRLLVEVDGSRDQGEPTGSRRRAGADSESYAELPENPFVRLTGDPESALSTFGLDVDTASYANVRRYLNRNEVPPPASVRLEELVNAFHYDDPVPESDALGVTVEAAGCPWAPDHRLVRIGIRGREISAHQRPASNLVFLLDVSGSMKDADKLPLLTQSLELMLDELRDDDRVAIVTYASGSQVVLPSTPVSDKAAIVAALRGLRADGSTHASEGIQLAYEVAGQAFLPEGNNRVLLATDGDFNVGVTSQDGLYELITGKAASGVYLTVLGFGTGNLKDDTAELLADKGNGNYAYIDSLDEAHRVLVSELEGTLHVIAKDAKVQVEFNPAKVASYRLLGYENRALAAVDFRNDAKDAGEVGAGHSLTVLYEVVPVGVTGEGGTADLRYQQPVDPTTLSDSPDLLTVNVRWLPPSGDGEAVERAVSLIDEGTAFAEADEDLRFATAVAGFGMVLRRSKHRGDIDLLDLAAIAEDAKGADPDGRRAEFVKLARTAKGVLGP